MDERFQEAARAVERILGVEIRNQDLLLEARTHASYRGTYPNHPVPNNERLEFLGDAVLQLVVTEALFNGHTEADEGSLTELRSAFVRNRTLGRLVLDVGLDAHLLWVPLLDSRPCPHPPRPSVLTCASFLEALIGCLYLDQGIKPCHELIERLILNEVDCRDGIDFKGRLYSVLLARQHQGPAYVTIQESGPEHEKTFRVACLVGESLLATGEDRTLRGAEVQAARRALAALPEWERRMSLSRSG